MLGLCAGTTTSSHLWLTWRISREESDRVSNRDMYRQIEQRTIDRQRMKRKVDRQIQKENRQNVNNIDRQKDFHIKKYIEYLQRDRENGMCGYRQIEKQKIDRQ